MQLVILYFINTYIKTIICTSSCSAWLRTWGPFIIFVFTCFAIYSYGKYF